MAKNIFLHDTEVPLPYVSPSTPFEHNYPRRTNPNAHAAFIREQSLTQKQVAALRYKDGVYLEFSGASQHDLPVKKLENLRVGIRLLNVRTDNDTIKATVYVPAGKESYFLEKVQAYAEPVEEGKSPKNNDLVRSIENVKLAMLDSFWFGELATMPADIPVWCEI